MIRQRINAGLERARKQGTKSGNPMGRPRLDPAIDVAIRDALKEGGKGIHRIAADLGVGSGTVQRIKQAMAEDGVIPGLDGA